MFSISEALSYLAAAMYFHTFATDPYMFTPCRVPENNEGDYASFIVCDYSEECHCYDCLRLARLKQACYGSGK